MIVRNISELPDLTSAKLLCVDLETTSFDDEVKALNPYQGHRTAGIGVCTEDHKTWYVPIRHRTFGNIPLENAISWLKDVLNRDIVNHNIPFDASFWQRDNIQVTGKLIDTMTLARLWRSDLPSLKLDYLTDGGKDQRVKEYLRKVKSKDYGRCPVEILGPYCENDTLITMKLYQKLIRELPSDSKDVWETETALIKHLVRTRERGVRVDWDLLKKTYRDMLRRCMELQEQINKIAEREVDLGSNADISELLIGQLGIQPLAFTKKEKRPQWNLTAYEQIKHPIGPLLREYSGLYHFTTSFCEGWLQRRGEDDRLHPVYQLAGAKTGRMSCVDPNFNNLSAEAELFILPESDDECILGGDYSQIEYRLFAHYANDPEIIRMYRENPETDYHQALAEILGVDRQFAKSLNFAFLYGMGKDKLLKMIAGICAINASDENMQAKMRTFLTGAAKATAERAAQLDLSAYMNIASNIYDRYHEKVPTIRQLKRRVENACRARGWLRNIRGRVYTVPPQIVYKGVNLLIQGSAADVYKARLLRMFNEMPGQHLMATVYDSFFWSVPKSELLERARKLKEIAEVFEYRVPLTVELKVSEKCWGTCAKVKNINLAEIRAAMEKSREVKAREWGKSA